MTVDPHIALRGDLRRSRDTARDIAGTAGVRCVKRRVLTAANVDIDQLARRLYGLKAGEQSPFAISQGERFEERLARNGHALLLQLLRDHERWPVTAANVVDLDQELPWLGGRGADAPRRRERVARARVNRTREIAALIASGNPEAPNVVRHPRFEIAFAGVMLHVEPDLGLWLPEQGPAMTLGEIKSFPHDRHRTDSKKLRQATTQTAVGAIAYQQLLDRIAPGTVVPTTARLILPVIGSFNATISPLPLRRGIETVRRGMDQTPRTLDEWLAAQAPGTRLDDPAVLDRLPIDYQPEYCVTQCPLAPRCREEVATCGGAELLGQQARQSLGPVPTLPRALRLAADPSQADRNEADHAALLSQVAQVLPRPAPVTTPTIGGRS